MKKHHSVEPKGDRKRGRKFALWSVAGFVVLALLLFLYTRDDALEDFSDLQATPVLSADADEVLEKWQEVCALGDDDAIFQSETGTDRHLLRRISGAFVWQQEPIDRILAANQKMIEAVPAADALGAFRFPQEANMSGSRQDLTNMRQLVKTLRIHAINRHHAGDADAALASALVSQRIADRIVEGGGVYIDLLVGLACSFMSYLTFDQLISSEMSNEALASIESALAMETDLATANERLLCNEFQIYQTVLKEDQDVLDIADGAAIFPAYQYKKNRTTNAAAHHFRSLLKQVRIPSNRRSYPFPPNRPAGLAKLSSNAAGNAILLSSLPTLETIIIKTDISLAYRRALRLKVAVVRYTKDHGQTPANLSVLVPEYLPAIPIDPLASKPLRYDPARGAIWSVGRDGLDQEGAVAKNHDDFTSSEHHDPTLWINRLPQGAEPEQEQNKKRRRSAAQRRRDYEDLRERERSGNL